MAKIDALPSLEIIRGLKGILDFYIHRGVPCVRAWPRYRPAKQTAASLAAALIFGAIVKSYSLLGHVPLEAYRDDALDQTRTARDIMVTGVYGNLHEASMSDFLDALIVSRDALVALTALLQALHSVDTDEIVTRVEHSVLPDGASTAAAQALALAQLQNIGDLQDALQSKALDRLLVRGMDQLFTYKDRYAERPYTTTAAAGTNHLASALVPAGEVWVITAAGAQNQTGPCSVIQVGAVCAGQEIFSGGKAPTVANEIAPAHRTMILKEDDRSIAYFYGCALNDTLLFGLNGYKMTLET